MLNDTEDYTIGLYDVFYVDEDTGEQDYTRIRAEDSDHAREIFNRQYPYTQITEVEYRGSAF